MPIALLMVFAYRVLIKNLINMITAVSQKKSGPVSQKDEERHRKVHIMQYHLYEVPE